MATIAVFGVLAGGGAWAASKLGPSDIAKNAIRAKHIKKNAVRSKHVKNGSLLIQDFKAGQLPAGTARAYGLIKADGTVDPQRSLKIGDVDKFGPGVYCIFLDPTIDTSTISAVASPADSPANRISVQPAGCSVNGVIGIQVMLVHDQTDVAIDGAFTLLVG